MSSDGGQLPWGKNTVNPKPLGEEAGETRGDSGNVLVIVGQQVLIQCRGRGSCLAWPLAALGPVLPPSIVPQLYTTAGPLAPRSQASWTPLQGDSASSCLTHAISGPQCTLPFPSATPCWARLQTHGILEPLGAFCCGLPAVLPPLPAPMTKAPRSRSFSSLSPRRSHCFFMGSRLPLLPRADDPCTHTVFGSHQAQDRKIQKSFLSLLGTVTIRWGGEGGKERLIVNQPH